MKKSDLSINAKTCQQLENIFTALYKYMRRGIIIIKRLFSHPLKVGLDKYLKKIGSRRKTMK